VADQRESAQGKRIGEFFEIAVSQLEGVFAGPALSPWPR
jgi:hypothetical protein